MMNGARNPALAARPFTTVLRHDDRGAYTVFTAICFIPGKTANIIHKQPHKAATSSPKSLPNESLHLQQNLEEP
jgi:hypothetical protein